MKTLTVFVVVVVKRKMSLLKTGKLLFNQAITVLNFGFYEHLQNKCTSRNSRIRPFSVIQP